MRINLTEVISRSEQGATHPFICRCDDGYEYYVKGNHAGRKALICEWMAGNIGRDLGLRIPEFKIIEISPDIITYGVREDIRDLSGMPAFGSRAIEFAQELTFTDIAALNSVIKAQILLFDWWVANGDRILSPDGGNPNLFISFTKTPEISSELWVIDHNLAFEEKTLDDFWEHHVFSNEQRLWDKHFIGEMTPKMNEAQKALQSYWNQVPDEWLEESGITFENIKSILQRVENIREFWRIS